MFKKVCNCDKYPTGHFHSEVKGVGIIPIPQPK